MRTHSPAKRQAILDGARREFLAHGYSGTSMESIAEAAPVSKPTLYRYFSSKHALFAAVVESQCDALFMTLSEATLTEPESIDGLKAIAEGFVDLIYSKDSLALYRLLIAEQIHFPELGAQVYQSSCGPMIEWVSRYLSALDRRGLVEIKQPDASSEILLGMLQGASHFRCLIGIQEGLLQDQRDALVEGAVSLFLKGHQS